MMPTVAEPPGRRRVPACRARHRFVHATTDRKAELIAELGIPMATAIEVPHPWRWRLWKMVRAKIAIRRRLADIVAAADPSDP
jgi:hypothetical protein